MTRSAELEGLESLALLDRAVELSPKCAEAHASRGIKLMQLRRFAEALAACDRAIELEPCLQTHECRAMVLVELCLLPPHGIHDDGAIAELELVGRLDPDSNLAPAQVARFLAEGYRRATSKAREDGSYELVAKASEVVEGLLIQQQGGLSPSDIVRQWFSIWRSFRAIESPLHLQYNQYMPDGTTIKPKFDASMREVARRYRLPVEQVDALLTAASTAQAAPETTQARKPAAAEVFAQAAATSPRRITRYTFTEAELRDPDAFNRARDTLADIATAYKKGEAISDEQRKAGNRAKAFIRRVSHLDAA